jgi:hypothetical protein
LQKQVLVLVGLAVLAGGFLRGEEPAKPDASQTMAWLQFIATELRELRREFVEDRLERQEMRVRALDRDLRQVRVEHQDGEEVERARSLELVEVDQQLANPALSAEDRAQLENLRNSVTTERTAVAQKEAQINDQLRREQARLESLRALARELAPTTTQTQH